MEGEAVGEATLLEVGATVGAGVFTTVGFGVRVAVGEGVRTGTFVGLADSVGLDVGATPGGLTGAAVLQAASTKMAAAGPNKRLRCSRGVIRRFLMRGAPGSAVRAQLTVAPDIQVIVWPCRRGFRRGSLPRPCSSMASGVDVADQGVCVPRPDPLPTV